ncbi:hypothetical protein QBC43DRAFT_315516 [Cladorrhinum sp. PSN259]|nr:hypothetical protein QBC43DRAFT_315516 [Cladorrhinum sp. PSN259]
MGKLRDIFHNLKLSASRQGHIDYDLEPSEPDRPPAHALDTLPTLPTPRRPLTAVNTDPQLTSTFFRLPPEIRQQIYRLLLSGRTFHFDMRYTSTEASTPHSTKGAQFGVDKAWRWRANTCHRHPDASVVSDRCSWGGPSPTACDQFSTPCGVGPEVMSFLLCCRLAYREAVQVIYAENTFHITAGALLLYNSSLLPVERSSAITSLVYTCTVETVWDHAPEHLRLKRGVHAYRTLLARIPVAFPSLKKFQFVLTNNATLRILRGQSLAVVPPVQDTPLKETLLRPFDTTVAAFGQRLEECVFIMNHGSSSTVRDEISEVAEKSEHLEGKWVQYWRPIVSDRAGEVEDEEVNAGYWIRIVSLADQRWIVTRLEQVLDQQLQLLELAGTGNEA